MEEKMYDIRLDLENKNEVIHLMFFLNLNFLKINLLTRNVRTSFNINAIFVLHN